MTTTSTMTISSDSLSPSSVLSNSFHTVRSPRKPHSQFSKAYKHASNFFLTRQFGEALSIIRPLVSLPQPSSGQTEHIDREERAPVAEADKKWRIRLWSFYLTLHNAIAELGLEEGKAIFGKQEWEAIVAKAENGSIWDEVIKVGYDGEESRVDAEVVLNLANLLLARSPNQRTNQDHLETYLSYAGPAESSVGVNISDTISLNSTLGDVQRFDTRSDLLHDLEMHIQIIELYTLHVLPQNGEWQYAENFVRTSHVLDDERKDAFIEALSDLQIDSHDGDDSSIQTTAEVGIGFPPSALHGSQMGRTDSTVTVIPAFREKEAVLEHEEEVRPRQGPELQESANLRSLSPRPTIEPALETAGTSFATLQDKKSVSQASGNSAAAKHSSLVLRSASFLSTFHKLVANLTRHISQNPASLLRFVLFLVAFLGALGRRDLRERLRALTGRGVEKLRRTLGMGVKVSYV